MAGSLYLPAGGLGKLPGRVQVALGVFDAGKHIAQHCSQVVYRAGLCLRQRTLAGLLGVSQPALHQQAFTQFDGNIDHPDLPGICLCDAQGLAQSPLGLGQPSDLQI